MQLSDASFASCLNDENIGLPIHHKLDINHRETHTEVQRNVLMSFQYEPPRHVPAQIRLLRIQRLSKIDSFKSDYLKRPDLEKTPLLPKCSIAIVNFENGGQACDFDALSYTWGPEYPKQAILLNGHRVEVG